MAHEAKYGTITTEHGSIPEDEPVFLLRAQDKGSVETLYAYLNECRRLGSPVEHSMGVENAISTFVEWQDTHIDAVKAPD